MLLGAVPSASPPPEPYDFEGLPNDLQTAITQYVKTISELNPLIKETEDDWKDVTKGFKGNHDYHKTTEGQARCKTILGLYKQFFFSGRAVTLGNTIGDIAKERWTELIRGYLEKLRDNGSGIEIPALEEGVKNEKILTVITDNRAEAEAVLSNEFGSVEIEDFYPFGFNFREYRNTFLYIAQSQEETSSHKTEADSAIRRFFSDPAYGFMRREELDPQMKKLIRLFDPNKSRYLTNYFFHARKDNRSYASEAENVLSQLDLLGWKEYIEPEPQDPNVQRLCNKLAQNKGVEIFGEGGLGKTALAYQFIRRNLNDDTYSESQYKGKQRIEPFERFRIITSKSSDQGEGEYWNYKVQKKGDPRNPELSIGEYNPNGTFEYFVELVASLFQGDPKDFPTPELKALDAIEKRRILVVIDNYEDISVNDENHKKYTDFLESIDPGSKGKVIVTSRPPSMGDTRLPVIKMKPFEMPTIYELLRKRLIWLNQKYSDQYTWSNKALELIQDRQFERVFETVLGELGDEFRKNMGSPPVLFVFTTILAEREEVDGLELQTSTEEEKGELFTRIAKSAKLHELIKDQDRYSVDHAYRLLKNKPVEIKILELLYRYPTKMTADDLVKKLQLGSRNKVDSAFSLLESHQIFLEVHEDDHARTGYTYRLSDKARRVLSDHEGFKDLEIDQTQLDVSKRISKERDRLESLKELIQSPQEFHRITETLEQLVGKEMDKAIASKSDTTMDRRMKIDPSNLALANACRVVLWQTIDSYREDHPRIVVLIEKFQKTILSAISVALRSPQKIEPPLPSVEMARLYIGISTDRSASDEWVKENLEYASPGILNAINLSPNQAPGYTGELAKLLLHPDRLPEVGT